MRTENAIFNIHKKPSTIYDVGKVNSCPPLKEIFCCRQTATTKVFSSLRTFKRSFYYICNGRGQKMPPCFEKNKKIYFLSRYMDNKIEIIYVQGML